MNRQSAHLRDGAAGIRRLHDARQRPFAVVSHLVHGERLALGLERFVWGSRRGFRALLGTLLGALLLFRRFGFGFLHLDVGVVPYQVRQVPVAVPRAHHQPFLLGERDGRLVPVVPAFVRSHGVQHERLNAPARARLDVDHGPPVNPIRVRQLRQHHVGQHIGRQLCDERV